MGNMSRSFHFLARARGTAHHPKETVRRMPITLGHDIAWAIRD
jgi:hypothetical protein